MYAVDIRLGIVSNIQIHNTFYLPRESRSIFWHILKRKLLKTVYSSDRVQQMKDMDINLP